MNSRPLELSVGVLSIIPALVITFLPDHSLSTGLLLFGLWALVAGVTASQLLRREGERAWRSAWQLTESIGVVALILWATGLYDSFNWLVGFWAAAFAALTLIRTRRSQLFIGVLTVAFGLAQLLMPVNPVVNVGLLGAYLVILGVWLVIGALSPRGRVEEKEA